MDNDIVLFESGDGQVTLPVRVDATEQEIWLNRAQLAVLFDRDVKTIGKHINNALREELAGQREVVVAKFATTRQHGAMEGRTQTRLTEHYGLDMVLSVGYRVKSKRGVEFRRWATSTDRQRATSIKGNSKALKNACAIYDVSLTDPEYDFQGTEFDGEFPDVPKSRALMYAWLSSNKGVGSGVALAEALGADGVPECYKNIIRKAVGLEWR